MQGSRVNCFNRAGLAAFDKVVQLISVADKSLQVVYLLPRD